jgi:hypothetical protein
LCTDSRSLRSAALLWPPVTYCKPSHQVS